MRVMQSRSVGTLHNIDIRVHPTLLLVLAWAVYEWGFSAGFSATRAAYGLLFVSLVFVCILLHELGHAWVATHFNLRVSNITLLPFGGLARVEHMTASPRTEASIALAGPLVNIAIAVFLLPTLLVVGLASGHQSISDFLGQHPSDPALGGLLMYLVAANVLIGAFNLLPAFPLDGGRILRSILSTKLGRESATNWAVAFGIVSALILGFFAISQADLFLAIIAVFIIATAIGEGRSVHIQETLKKLEVGRFSVWDGGGVSPEVPVALALREGPRDIAVTSNGQVLGMLWSEHVSNALQNGGLERKIGELLDVEVQTAESSRSIYDVYELMMACGQWAIPVTENGRYRGLFTAERFVHIHRHLQMQSPSNRRFAAFSGSLGHALKGFTR